MTSVKLTQTMREAVLKDLMSRSKHQEQRRAWAVKMHAFALKVYEDLFSKKERELMESLPKGWLPEKETITVQFERQFVRLPFSFHTYGPFAIKDEQVVKKRMPLSSENRCNHVYEANHPLSKEYEKLEKEANDIDKAEGKLKTDIVAILNSCTTSGKLYETWPEMEPVLARHVPSSQGARASLPAKIISDVTKQINLEPKKEA